MGYHPRIESSTIASLLTTRTRNSQLWFVNNERLEEAILGYTAKFAARYGVKLYALAIEGNHIQGPALFPNSNRAAFMRDLNACVARAVPRHVPTYPGGRFWGRRYSNEFLPGNEDVEDRFFYTVLQPVQDGLVEKISDYPGYNCFHDAIWGRIKKFKVVKWAEYNAAIRRNLSVKIKDYVEIVELRYERLPGYEKLTQKEYAHLMQRKLEKRRLDIVLRRSRGFLGREKLLKTRPGSSPISSKRSTQSDHRPRVLSICHKRRAECKAWYFSIHFSFKEASRRYRLGEYDTEFPEGTYRPYVPHAPPVAA